MKIKKLLCLVAYYGFARYLPASTSPMTRWARKIRRLICRPIFDKCGENVNVESGACFATGGVFVWVLVVDLVSIAQCMDRLKSVIM